VGGTLADRWLNPKLTIKEEGLHNSSRLVWKIKYFKYPKKLRDPKAVYYFYAQVRSQVVDNTLETGITMAFKLAALQLAVHFQSNRPQDLRVGYMWNKLSEMGEIMIVCCCCCCCCCFPCCFRCCFHETNDLRVIFVSRWSATCQCAFGNPSITRIRQNLC
jgi:hypothetical protein